jgi:hypothetical protein
MATDSTTPENTKADGENRAESKAGTGGEVDTSVGASEIVKATSGLTPTQAVSPAETQLVLAAPIPEPAPGENIYVTLAPGEPFTFAFSLSDPGVYATLGSNGEIIIHVPHGDGGEGTYGHVIITGISADEFIAATGELIVGYDSGIPELRDPNDGVVPPSRFPCIQGPALGFIEKVQDASFSLPSEFSSTTISSDAASSSRRQRRRHAGRTECDDTICGGAANGPSSGSPATTAGTGR